MPRQIHFAEKAAGSQTNSSPFRSGARTGIRKSAENKAAGLTDAALQDKLLEIATGTCLQYDQGDDWTIPETDENGNSSRIRTRLAALTDINEMPDITSEDSAGNMTLSREGMDAVKRELLQGRGVTASCHAEAYVPGRRSTNYYFNFDNWAHYTYEHDFPAEKHCGGHEVCIIGWDDDDPAENFTHVVRVLDESGNERSTLPARPEPPRPETAPGSSGTAAVPKRTRLWTDPAEAMRTEGIRNLLHEDLSDTDCTMDNFPVKAFVAE